MLSKRRNILLPAVILCLFCMPFSSFSQNEMGNFGILINPAGFLQFGPILQGEIKLGPNTIIGPHVRFIGLGLLYHLIVEYDEASLSGMGIGVAFKQFFGRSASQNQFYFGASAEYGWGSGKNLDSGWDWRLQRTVDTEFEHAYIGLSGNFGYRWRFGSGLFMNLGAMIGIGIEVEDKQTYPYETEYEHELYPLGMVEFAFGWSF